MIKIKRIYDKPDDEDGFRILIDRLWPRGLNKDWVKIDLWLKDIAPSNELRKWFSHDPDNWVEFKKRYFAELSNKKESTGLVLNKERKKTVTLLYGAKDEKFNNAVALNEYIEKSRQ